MTKLTPQPLEGESMDPVEVAKSMVNSSDYADNVQICVKHGIDMGDLFGATLMKSAGSKNFDNEMNDFLDEIAASIGDFIGAACGNPKDVLDRFGNVLIGTAIDRIEGKSK